MANIQFDDSDDDFSYHRPRFQGTEQQKNYPRAPSKLIKTLFTCHQDELIEMIIELHNKQKLQDFQQDLDSLEARPQISGEKQMKDDFLIQLTSRIDKAFIYLHQHGIQQSNPKQLQFVTAFKSILKQISRIRLKDNFIQQFWETTITAPTCSLFIQYMGVFHRFYRRTEKGIPSRKMSKQKKNETFAKIRGESLVLLSQIYEIEAESKKQEKQEETLSNIYKNLVKDDWEEIIFHLQIASHIYELDKDMLPEKLTQKLTQRILDLLKNQNSENIKEKTDIKRLFSYLNYFSFTSQIFSQLISLHWEISDRKVVFKNKNSQISTQFITFQHLKECLHNKTRNKIDFLDQQSVKVQDNIVYTAADFQILEMVLKQINEKNCYHSQTILFDINSLVSLILDNLDKELILGDNTKGDIFGFFCRMFEILVYYMIMIFRSQNLNELQSCYDEQFVKKLLNKILDLASDPQKRSSPTLIGLYGNIFSYIAYYAHLFSQGDLELKTFMISSIMKMLQNFQFIPSQWRVIKHARFIIQKWAISEALEQIQLRQVIKMFMKAFFSYDFVFSRDSYFIFIKDKAPSQAYQEVFSEIFLEYIRQISEQLFNSEKNMNDQDVRLKFDRFVFTIHLILLGNFKMKNAYEVCEIIYKIYTKYAQYLPSVHFLRTLISEHYKPDGCEIITKQIQITVKSVQSLKFLENNSLSALECLQPYLPESLQKRQSQVENYKEFIQKSTQLINLLQLKSELQNLSHSSYNFLIHDIINFLSDSVGEMYNKILNQMMKSKEDNENIEKILIRNFFMEQKSIYRQCHEIMFALKNIIRIYICNLTDYTNFQEIRCICTEIGKLLENLHQRSHRQQRTRIQLINQFLSNYVFKKKSHLLVKQTIYSSNAYTTIKNASRKQTLNRNSFLSLNIVIPIFSVLRQMMPHYIKLLTSYGRQEFEGRYRFNHHIAFENELRKVTQNTDIFEVVIKNTLITHATSLINSIFLPKINNRTDALEEIGLSLYIKQFQQIFNAEECSDYIQDHIATFIQIYKHKNRSQVSRARLLERTYFKDEPSNFEKYDIEPISHEQFKEKARIILLKFLQKLPQKIFGMNARKFSLRALLGVIKEYNGTEKEEQSNTEFYNEEQFLMLLIEKSQSVLKDNLEKRQLEALKEKIEEQTVKSEQKKDKKKKVKGIEYSSLCMVFKMLAHVGRDKINLVKHTFKYQIQNLIIQILLTKQTKQNLPEINQCFVFLFETLPKFSVQMSQKDTTELFSYYMKLLNLLDQFKYRPIFKIEVLFIKLIQNSIILKEIDFSKYATIRNRITYILNQSLNSHKTINELKFVLIKFMVSDEKLIRVQMQMEIKAYIYEKYFEQLKSLSKTKTKNKYYGNPHQIAIEVRNFIKDFRHDIIDNQAIFRELSKTIFTGWTADGHYLLYHQGINSLLMSKEIIESINQPFYKVPIENNTLFFLNNLVHLIMSSTQELQQLEKKIRQLKKSTITQANKQMQQKNLLDTNDKKEQPSTEDQKALKSVTKNFRKVKSKKAKSINLLEYILDKFKLFIPYVMNQLPVQNNQDFLDWLIQQSIHSLESPYIDLITLILNRNFLYFNQKQESYCKYVAARIINKLLPQLQSESNGSQQERSIIYLLLCCLTIKDFNDLSGFDLSQKNKVSLAEFFKSKMSTLKKTYESIIQTQSSEDLPPIELLYAEGFYLMAKNMQIKKFQEINNLFEELETNEAYFINPKLFFITDQPMFGKKRIRYSSRVLSLGQIFYKFLDHIQTEHMFKSEELKGNIYIEQIMKDGQVNLNTTNCQSKIKEGQIIDKFEAPDIKLFANSYQHNAEKKYNKIDLIPSSFRFDAMGKQRESIIESKTISCYRDIISYLNPLKQLAKRDKQNFLPSDQVFRLRKMSDEEYSDDSENNEDEQTRKKQPLRILLLKQIEDGEREDRSLGFRVIHRDQQEVLLNPVEFLDDLGLLRIQSSNILSSTSELPIQKHEKEENIKHSQNIDIQVDLQEKKERISETEDQIFEENLMQVTKKQSTTKTEIQEALMLKVQEQENEQSTERIDNILHKYKLDQNILVNEMGITKSQLVIKNDEEIADILSGIIDGKQRQQLHEMHLSQNQNYRILSKKKNYYDRCNFLIDAPETFFTDLPLQVRSEIIRERDTLRRDNYRSNRSKEYQEMLYNEENNNNRVSFYTGGGMGRKLRQKNLTYKKYKKIPEQKEIKINDQTITAILYSILIKICQRDSHSNCINLLLELEAEQINSKTLTTLIIMMKKPEKVKILSYQYGKIEGSWEKKFLNPKNGNITNFRQQILKNIYCSIQNRKFENDKLIMQRTSFNCYSEIFDNLSQHEAKDCFDQQLGADNNSYLPLNQLLSIVLDDHIKMVPQFMKKAKQVPKKLIEKIFEKTFEGKMPLEFYDQAQILENDELLTELFRTRYSLEKPPSFQLLGKIIKYKFGKLPYLKDLHQKALKYHSSSHNQFLRQIFREYSREQLQQKADNFIKYRQIHFKLIEELFDEGIPIQNEHIAKLIDIPDLLDFKTKKMIFLRHPKFQTLRSEDDYSQESSLQIDIDNKDILRSSYNGIMTLINSEIRKRISVKFIGQSAFGEGMFKVWINQVAKQIFNPSNCLFVPLGQQDTYQPNPYSYQNPQHLNYFKFLGRLLGVAILQNQVVPAFFTKIFYKTLLNKVPHYTDLKDVNPDLYETIKYIKNSEGEGDIEMVGYTFVYKGLDLQGEKIEKELKPGGKQIVVTEENKQEFISLATKQVLTDFCTQQYEKIKEGFNDIIPAESLSIFSVNDLQLLISGIPEISIEEFKRYTKYSQYHENDQIIQWFWEVVQEASKEELTNILQFITGTSRLAEGGFAKNPITIKKANATDQWPRGVTCFNSLQLPEYNSKQILKDRLTKVIIWSKGGIGLQE